MTVDISQVTYQLRDLSNIIDWWAKSHEQFKDLVSKMEALGYDAKLSTSGLDFVGTGNRQKLVDGLRVLRSAGYSRNLMPGPKDTSYSCFLQHDTEKSIWFQFSSSVCRRVQVGTEMKEVPVYEITCDEPETLEVTEGEL